VGKNMHNKFRKRRREDTFMATLTAALGLFVIGYPLAPDAVRTTLLSYLLIVAGAARFVLGSRFFTTRPAETMTPVPVRSADYTQ